MAAVVVRWYGGTNLGVGGLVRAYGGALARALEGAPVVRCERAAVMRLTYTHDQTAAVMRCVTTTAAATWSTTTAERRRRAELPRAAEVAATRSRCLRDATRGAVAPERLGESVDPLRG